MRSRDVHSARSLDDSIVIEQVEAYREAILQGLQPDREQLLRQFPEIAGQLAGCLNAIEMVGQLAPQVNEQIENEKSGGKITADSGLPATSLGDFHIFREIGRGGMGVVYEAEQLSLGRRVAVKVLPLAGLWSEVALKRFRNEVRLAAMLEHPHIVPIYFVGCERGVNFYAMKLVDGCSLADIIQHRRLTAGNANSVTDEAAPPSALVDTCVARLTAAEDADQQCYRAVARQGLKAAEALAYAHKQGIVHRDVKPSNLLLDHEGRLYVSDFGLARLETDNSLTRTGDVLGTPRYMSPEQASGQPLDQRTDIYSLGATLYELLTLEPVIQSRNRAEVLQALDKHQVIPPRVHDPQVPRPLERIVLKCLQRNPADRYGSAGELAEDLSRFLENAKVQARPPGITHRSVRWIEHNRAQALFVAVACCLLIGIGIVIGMMHKRGRGAPEARGSPLAGSFDSTSPRSGQSDSTLSEESSLMLRTPRNTRQSAPSRRRRLLLEQLEDRRLLTSTPGLPWLEQAELTASPSFSAGDLAGQNISMDGDTIVVSAHRDDEAGTDAGAAYVFVRDDAGTPNNALDDSWTQQAKLIGSDVGAQDHFGYVSRISGDTLVVGANQRDSGGPGAAYVFERHGTSWIEVAKLIAGDGADGDKFGRELSISGDTVVIGADRNDELATDAGAAYVFVRPSSGWAGTQTETSKLTATDGQAGDWFGRSIEVDGDLLLIGADQQGNGGAGKVYVFARDENGTPQTAADDIWLEQTTLSASDGTAGDAFGMRVDLDASYAVVTAHYDDHGSVVDAGSVYVFLRNENGTPLDPSDDTWQQDAKLMASDASTGDRFGFGLGIENDLIVVGSVDGEIGVPNSGSVYFFSRQGGVWSEVGEITASDEDPAAFSNFGTGSIGISGDIVVVGDPQHDHNNSGGAFVFVKSDASIVASDLFESGTFLSGLGQWSSGAWTVSGDASIRSDGGPHSGLYHARLRRGSGDLRREVDVSGLQDVRLRFWSKLSSFEGSDEARVLVSGDGNNWTTLTTFVDGQDDNEYHHFEFDVPDLGDTLHIRFEAAMNQRQDIWYIDNVEVIGAPSGPVGNLPPSVDAGSDLTESDDDASGSESVTLVGSATDSDGSIDSVQWSDSTGVLGTSETLVTSLPVGVHTLTFSATDNEGASSSDSVIVTVLANQGPIADAGSDQTIFDSDGGGDELVTLDGSGSMDVDGTIVAYEWKEGTTVLGTSAIISPTLSLGSHTVTLTVTDNAGATDSDTVVVTVSEALTGMHVGDLDASSTNQGSRWTAIVTISVHDSGEGPVDGVIVNGSWSGSASGNASCTTDSDGTCTVQKPGIKKNKGVVTFTVTDVSGSLDYDENGNHDPDGDSDGTAIDVNKPLYAAEASAPEHLQGQPLTPSMVRPAVDAALAHWAAAGVTTERLDRLRGADVEILDLDGSLLGLAYSNWIVVDRDAAGFGWSSDSTSAGPSAGVDLVWAVTHELGHLLGYEHSHEHSSDQLDVMAATVSPLTGRFSGRNTLTLPDGQPFRSSLVRRHIDERKESGVESTVDLVAVPSMPSAVGQPQPTSRAAEARLLKEVTDEATQLLDDELLDLLADLGV